MKLMAYNIFEGGAGRIDPLAEVIRLAQADVIIIAEAWDEALFHKLADRLHMDRFLADSPTNPKGATGLLTRLPIIEAINHAPLDQRLTRSAFHAIIELPSLPHSAFRIPHLPLIGLHLHARETLADESIRLSELPALFDIAQQFGDRPHLLAGDFNASHPQQLIDFAQLRPKTQTRLAAQNNEIPRDVIRTILEHGYLDAHALHHPPADFHTSFTTAYPATRVDYLFVTPTLAPHVTSCEIFKPEIAKYASDHYPLLAELNL
jgi:endonuclease/exonuclease/phosphatase family metal-dependent hydrolase